MSYALQERSNNDSVEPCHEGEAERAWEEGRDLRENHLKAHESLQKEVKRPKMIDFKIDLAIEIYYCITIGFYGNDEVNTGRRKDEETTQP